MHDWPPLLTLDGHLAPTRSLDRHRLSHSFYCGLHKSTAVFARSNDHCVPAAFRTCLASPNNNVSIAKGWVNLACIGKLSAAAVHLRERAFNGVHGRATFHAFNHFTVQWWKTLHSDIQTAAFQNLPCAYVGKRHWLHYPSIDGFYSQWKI